MSSYVSTSYEERLLKVNEENHAHVKIKNKTVLLIVGVLFLLFACSEIIGAIVSLATFLIFRIIFHLTLVLGLHDFCTGRKLGFHFGRCNRHFY
jgi:hypothetical protein